MESFFEDHRQDAFGCMVEVMGEDFDVTETPTVSLVHFPNKFCCHVRLVVFMSVLFLISPR